MARTWTEKQTDAIKARNGSVLVSAAAGSGKTAVLVERVIERITDEKNPSSIDRLLIVTFTKAAAGEMRQRISDAVESQLKQKPGNKNLINQQMLLPSAKICTMDSFCSSLARDNFQQLDISPDFKIPDSGEIVLLRNEAMTRTLDELYAEGNNDFLNLVELLFQGRDDKNIEQMIAKIYDMSRSYPFPQRWIDEIADDYSCCGSVMQSKYGQIIMEYVKDALEYCRNRISFIEREIYGWEEMEKAFGKIIELYYAQIDVMLERIGQGDWNGTYSALKNFSGGTRGRIAKDLQELPDVAVLTDTHKQIKEIIKGTSSKKGLADYMCASEEEYLEDTKRLEPMVRQLCRAAKLFAQNYAQIKEEKDFAEFDDIMHMALSLLVKETKSGYERTELAAMLSDNYDEILIDEYQDTNKAQDMLFTAISNNNLFRVGDVKQSIYRFRRAMPEIFIELKNTYDEYDREKDNYPSKIILGNNFRSRKSVTGAVNFVFAQMMSSHVGDIDYGKEEELVFSAAYPETDEATQLHLIETQKTGEEKHRFQARYIADLINDMISSGFTVKDGDSMRKASYKDFCVLMRSVNGGTGAVYAEEFRKKDIPCFAEVAVDFFSAYEVSLVLSLLRVIDNPKQDIALLTVMMSALFGFSVDDMAKLRIDDRESDIYGCLLFAKKNGSEKVCGFLDKISQWRSLSVSMGVEQFIREIYDDTSLLAIISAMKNADARTANLLLLLDYAVTYEKAGYIGLSGFIGFIDRLEREKHDLSGSLGVSSDADVVKVMTIHKSKGLEFPVCILANCTGKINHQDENGNMVVSSKAGLGFKMRDTQTLAQYPTTSLEAVKLSVKKDTVSEEMRVLYVAMTRAKEKLIMINTFKDVDSKLQSYGTMINPNSNRSTPFASSMAGSYADWIIPSFMRHKDAQELREIAGTDENIILPSDFALKTVIIRENEKEVMQKDEQALSDEIDEELLDLVKQRAEYRYEYEPLTYVVSKRAASEVDKNSVDREYFASSRPAFLSENGLTAAQRGTATHSFMQYAYYEKANINVKAEIERLKEKGIITAAEAGAINVRAVERFFKSGLAKRILASDNVMREKKFTVNVPVGELYPELAGFSDETVMIQGIADCAFVENGKLIVVDYKTDRLETEQQFADKYGEQVRVYKRALSLCTDYEVSETLLYSFALSKEISVI